MSSSEKRIRKHIDLALMPDVENHYAFFSGETSVFTLVNFIPMIDCHMHIESNNCAPLTLQWGLVREATSKLLKMDGTDRKNLNVTTALFLNMGEVGRMGTDYIAKLFMNDLLNFKVKSDLLWTFIIKHDLNRYETLRQEAENKLKTLEKEGLTDRQIEALDSKAEEMRSNYVAELMKKRNRDYASFHEYAAYYFYRHKIVHIWTAMPMDMSYAHYWGEAGIPVYLPFERKGRKGYYYINDHKREKVFICNKDRIITTDGNVRINYDDRNRMQIDTRLNYDMDFAACNNMVKSLFRAEGDKKGEKLAYYNSRKYKHFIDIAPSETDETFEDYRRQLANTMTASVLYPFEIIPFYHYDPRRHVSNNKTGIPALAAENKKLTADDLKALNDKARTDKIDSIIDKLKAEHIFLKYKDDAETDGSILLSEAHIYDKLKESLANDLITNKEVFETLLPSTKDYSFFGIKIYPKLGYAPHDYAKYPQLRELYEYCAANKIPITTHCSPGGMTIADSHIYLKEAMKKRYSDPCDTLVKEALSRGSPFYFTNKNPDNLTDSHRFINDTCHHPRSWEKVLREYRIKLCFAHFGGEECFHTGKEKLKEYWAEDISEIIGTYPDVYTDLAYFINRWEKIPKIAEELSGLINKYGILKERIIMGSDWYMIEREPDCPAGVDSYYRRMFEVLRRVSGKTGFDAWYRFTVENPLRYLGFIESGNNKISECSSGMAKLNAHKEYIIKKTGIGQKENNISEEIKDFLKYANIKNKGKIEEQIDKFLGSNGSKQYYACENPVDYTGYVNQFDLGGLRDMKDIKTGRLLILKEPCINEEENVN